MRRSLLHIIMLSLCLWPAALLLAQSHSRRTPTAASVPAPELKGTVDKQKILIGEPIQLMLEATVHADVPVIWPPLDSLAHFDWVERHAVDSTVSPGQRYYRQYLTITSFDSGTRFIPRMPFVVGNETYFTDSIRIDVGYTKIDQSKDYHDIKDIVEVPNAFARWFGWIVAAVSLGSVALVIWLIRKKKILKILIPRQQPRLSPYQEAMAQLDELGREHLVENGAVKAYYSRLGDILRIYLYRQMGIASLAETSEELIQQLRRLPIPAQQFTELSEALRMSDFVKFAKYLPGLADSEFHYKVIRSSIEELNKLAEAEAEKKAAEKARASDKQLN